MLLLGEARRSSSGATETLGFFGPVADQCCSSGTALAAAAGFWEGAVNSTAATAARKAAVMSPCSSVVVGLFGVCPSTITIFVEKRGSTARESHPQMRSKFARTSRSQASFISPCIPRQDGQKDRCARKRVVLPVCTFGPRARRTFVAENFPVEMEWTFRLGSHQQFRRAAFVIHVLLLVARTPSTKEKSNVASKQMSFVDRLLTSRHSRS